MKRCSKIKYPLVSIIMPVYNQENYVGDAIDSVLMQTYENFEIVISDDCSQDKTSFIVKQYANKFPEKIRFLKLADKNLGGDKHFAMLLKECKGDYICMFSGDDILYPEKISTQINEMLEFNLSCHGHSVDCIDESGLIFDEIGILRDKFITSSIQLIFDGIPIAATSWMMKKKIIKINSEVGFLHDFDMIVSSLKKGGLGYISNKKLSAYRITKTSWSRNLTLKDYINSYLKLIISWIQSRQYIECIYLLTSITIKLPNKLLNFLRKEF